MDIHYGTKEHKDVETELKKWGGPFPEHCMEGSEGQQQIDETRTDAIIDDDNIFIITKQTYDVFSNPETKKILKEVKEAVVYGVATDYCVKAVVLGMLEVGIKVTVVGDAIKGVDKRTTHNAIRKMIEKGAVFVKTEEIIK